MPETCEMSEAYEMLMRKEENIEEHGSRIPMLQKTRSTKVTG